MLFVRNFTLQKFFTGQPNIHESQLDRNIIIGMALFKNYVTLFCSKKAFINNVWICREGEELGLEKKGGGRVKSR